MVCGRRIAIDSPFHVFFMGKPGLFQELKLIRYALLDFAFYSNHAHLEVARHQSLVERRRSWHRPKRKLNTNRLVVGFAFVPAGFIITVMQLIFSAIFYFVSVALFPGFLMVGYATIFTMFPVFSLVLDKDVLDSVAMTYPELYKELAKGRELTFKTFFIWTLISIYQGKSPRTLRSLSVEEDLFR